MIRCPQCCGVLLLLILVYMKYYTLEGKKKTKSKGKGISTKRPWQPLAPIPLEQGKHTDFQSDDEDLIGARFFLP